MRIERREQDGLGAHDTKVGTTKRLGHNVLRLRRAAIVTSQLAAIDDVRVQWISSEVTVFFGRDRMPFAKRDLPVVATARNANRSAFLLTATKPVRKSVVRAHVIDLRGRLVVPTAPALPSIHRNTP